MELSRHRQSKTSALEKEQPHTRTQADEQSNKAAGTEGKRAKVAANRAKPSRCRQTQARLPEDIVEKAGSPCLLPQAAATQAVAENPEAIRPDGPHPSEPCAFLFNSL